MILPALMLHTKGDVIMVNRIRKWISIIAIVGVAIIISSLICWHLIPKPMFHGDYPYYPDVESITNAADVIIVGDVVTGGEVKDLIVDTTPNKPDKTPIPYTLSTVKVKEVVKGNVHVGDVLTIKQLGDYKNKPEEALHKIDGYLVKNTEQLMFLSEYNDSPYSPMNPYQGAIQIKEGVLHSNSEYSLFGFHDDDSLDSSINIIREYVN